MEEPLKFKQVKNGVQVIMKDSYSVPEVAEILATSRQQVRLLISTGKLKAWNMGAGTVRKRWRVNIENLNKFQGK